MKITFDIDLNKMPNFNWNALTRELYKRISQDVVMEISKIYDNKHSTASEVEAKQIQFSQYVSFIDPEKKD